MLEFDPIANIFPLIEGQARDDFRADIDAKGLQEKIVLRHGRVLDGRNRYLALIHNGEVAEDAPADMLLKYDGNFVDFDVEHPGADPFDWVMSLNVHRRHLEPSQWAAVAANAETLKHGGARRSAKPEDDGEPQDANLHLDRATLAKTFNVSPRLIASAAKVRKQGAPELFDAIAQGKVKATVAEQLLTLPKGQQAEAATALEARQLPTLAKQTKRADTERRLGEKVRALPKRLFPVILADPAWRFEPYSRETGLDRSADNHYPTQETAEIKVLPVGTLAAPDCVLFLWATAPMLPDALAALRFWGFDYKTHVIWRKAEPHPGGGGHSAGVVLGTGYWFRNGHELLLVGTRGNVPAPAMGTQYPSIVDAPPRRHSQKPDWAYELIEAYFPNLPKIELNSRAPRAGWDAWGNESSENSVATEGGQADATMAASPATQNSPATASGGADVEASLASAGREAALGEAVSLATSPLAAYEAALAASVAAPGQHSKASAEPILRAAYSSEPPVPIQRVADDLGAKKNTVLSWASRLALSKTERRATNGLAAVRAARSQLASGGSPE